jgi:4a-hydroxytetrahydrobiopterin dehydratase
MPDLLPAETLARALDQLPHWRLEDGQLRRSFRFPDFGSAFGFIARVALAAERMDHHPDWSNRYDRVEIALSTHAAGGLTRLDLELARAIDRIAGG